MYMFMFKGQCNQQLIRWVIIICTSHSLVPFLQKVPEIPGRGNLAHYKDGKLQDSIPIVYIIDSLM